MSFFNTYKESSPMSDLALERRRANIDTPGVEYKRERGAFGVWERIKIRSPKGAAEIGRPMGIYDTLTLPKINTLDYEGIDDAINEIATELCKICDALDIAPDTVLVVGLGNPSLTPDAVGAMCAAAIEPTLHIYELDEEMFNSLECSKIAVIAPGVSAKTGMDTSVIVKGVCDRIHPDVILAVDAIASRSPSRLGTTVQISDTGILPGSCLGKNKGSLDADTLGVPVIAIGVPTVIDTRFLCGDDEREADCASLFVCPKDINEIVENSAKIIAGGINQAFGLYS